MNLRKAETNGRGLPRAFTGKGLFRSRFLVTIAAAFTAMLLIIDLVPKPPSQAAGLEGSVKVEDLEYTVGKATITPLKDGIEDGIQTCRVVLPYTAMAPNPAGAENVKQSLMAGFPVNYKAADGTPVQFGSYGDPQVSGNTVTFQMASWHQCDQLGDLKMYTEDYVSVEQPVEASRVRNDLRNTGPTITMAAYGTRAGGIPSWGKAALGVLAAAAVFAVVIFAATAAGSAAAAAAGEVAGILVYTAASCVASAVGSAVADYIAAKFADFPESSWTDRLLRLMTACVLGGALGAGGRMMSSMGGGLSRAAGMAATDVGGQLPATVTSQGGFELTDALRRAYPVAVRVLERQ